MDSPLTKRALDFGVTYTRAAAQAGQPLWRLLSVDGPLERGDNANIYVDVLDENGNRLAGIPVRFFWNNGEFVSPTEPKPGEPDQGTNMVMSAGGNAYGVNIEGTMPTDTVWGMGNVAWQKHHSWRVVFQRNIATPDDDSPTPVPAPKTASAALRLARYWIDEAERLL